VNFFVFHSQSFAGNLNHLRVKTLTHFSSTVTQQN
jgi:hypothetical protein